MYCVFNEEIVLIIKLCKLLCSTYKYITTRIILHFSSLPVAMIYVKPCLCFVSLISDSVPLAQIHMSTTITHKLVGTAYTSGAYGFFPILIGSGCSVFSLLRSVLQIIVLFHCFLLTIVLSVFLRFTASDYPFSIFKLFYTLH